MRTQVALLVIAVLLGLGLLARDSYVEVAFLHPDSNLPNEVARRLSQTRNWESRQTTLGLPADRHLISSTIALTRSVGASSVAECPSCSGD